MGYVVICREETLRDGVPGEYVLATRRVFVSREDAETYSEGISVSREPIVVEGRWSELRSSTEELPRTHTNGLHYQTAPYPHEGACAGCREERRCNFCGADLILSGRCTNGRCDKCHLMICGRDENHGFGKDGGPHFETGNHVNAILE